jgi:hypothetical protein
MGSIMAKLLFALFFLGIFLKTEKEFLFIIKPVFHPRIFGQLETPYFNTRTMPEVGQP